MKTVTKINPEKEYEIAKDLIVMAGNQRLDIGNLKSLGDSVDNLVTVVRVLMDREERRRGYKNPPPKEGDPKPKGRKKGQERNKSDKRPSKCYPKLEIQESIISPNEVPRCPCCSKEMKESGLHNVSEKIEHIPARFYIQRTKRPIHTCPHCHGSMVNTPAVPSIVPTSNYGDSLIIDASLSKYCDLIPLERYADIAFRNGLEGLPPQSLIGLTHHLANFLFEVYEEIKQETLAARVLLADESPHRMLEGDEKKNWFLWGFLSQISCFFEVHNTRSGDVVFEFLKDSKAEYLLSDGYSGYGKAIKDIKEKQDRDIIPVHCNAHAYRYFKEASITWEKESLVFLELYGKIYGLERERKEKSAELPEEKQLEMRKSMLPFFEEMKKLCEQQQEEAMPESGFKKALNYFLNHYKGLTLCTDIIEIPLDNNLAERELRAPVIGRKTWYGTHSKRGAITNAVLFTIVQTCKMNKVNPRQYFPWVVERIHQGLEPLTPHKYLALNSS